MRGRDQRLLLKSHDALVAVAPDARIDGHGEMPAAEQRALVTAALQPRERSVRLVEVGVPAHLARRLEV